MRSDAQLTRLLRLVPFLSSRPGITVASTAEAFNVSARQIIRDLEVLQYCGLPGGYFDDLFDVDIEAVREQGVIDFRNAEVLSRPLRLRPAEAASLLAALRLVVDVAGESEAAASALAKLESAVGAGDEPVRVTVAPSDPGLRARLSEAIAGARVVRLTYRKPALQGESVADVEPSGVRLVDGYSYLDAWSRPRQAWRSYRLDRIVAASTLDEVFEPRGGQPAGWFDDVSERLTVTVAPAGNWIAEYYPTTAVEQTPEGLRVTFPVASREWAIGLLLRLGDAVVAVSDASVVDDTRARAAEALAHYRDPVG